jgi:hypothetical protein
MGVHVHDFYVAVYNYNYWMQGNTHVHVIGL